MCIRANYLKMKKSGPPTKMFKISKNGNFFDFFAPKVMEKLILGKIDLIFFF